MQIENWDKVSALFDDAMEMSAETRADFIRSKAETEDIAEQVLRLVNAAERETGFLATGDDGMVVTGKSLAEGTRLGNWQIGRSLGAGGMGEVYLATRADGLYDQTAALKLIASNDRRTWDLFARERQVLANLEHSGIGRLIDGGVAEDGRPFLVMEHVDGAPIDVFAREKKLPREAVLRLFLKVCDAVSHAHGRLVLHRDIKPNNILVTADGTPRLIDFGVAGLLTEDDESRAPMTLRYAAPEQLRGEAASVETDVFGLGATLHESLTGQTATRTGMSLNVDAEGEPDSIKAILAKALADEPEDRYSSAEALGADIRAWLTNRPVQAMAGGTGYRLGLFLKRNALATTAVSAVILALGAGLAGTIWQAEEAARERDLAIQERERLRAMQQATFVMFSEASDGAETTSRELVSRSAQRVLEEFEDNPAEAAPVLHMYGEIFYLMNDYQAAEPLLRAVADLPDDSFDRSLIAQARHDLAVILFRLGNAGESRTYLDDARTVWAENPDLYTDARLDAALIESQLLADAGDVEASVVALRNAIPERLAFSGRESMDAGILYTNLGAALMRTGDLPGAIEATENARDVFSSIERLESPDGLNVMNNLATFYHVTGDLQNAETAYSETLRLRRDLYGGSVALAVLMSNYAKLKIQNGDLAGALALFDEAIPMADEYGSASGPAALAARYGRIEALILNDDLAVAQTMLNEAGTLLEEGGLSASVYGGMQALYQGQLAGARGERETALAMLDEAQIVFEAAGPAAGRYVAKVEQIRDAL
ncbi:serine/threonine-protein kinase [Ponticaulis sp.]|uniref:serine/threonine-protein kinase n=1 Tax=Ponticaulis sp. TaxID=2020902 RepID=UPI000C543A0B|nr:serine/threonine-protein kinase [Ponticaulis sp.]MAF59075.1 hypothetical protein [Ponticaulis sp.]MBN03065.1 hypothetical protein [Ponticaulis sp.]